ncbi:MAG: histidine triad nucleotide-binding protein [Dehalococcoidia bacterium]|nr:histidine triad nucleotide-binding protein [Dehalococcoidia bacterium]
MAECIFCSIGKRQTPAQMLFQDDLCFVIRDINPAAPIHLLVIPNQHVTSLANLKSDQESLVGHLFSTAHEMARREGVTDTGFRLVVNQGRNAGQHVDHLHLHVLGGKRLPALG